jgi:ComF family protein
MFHTITQSIITTIFPPLCIHCQREGSWLCTPAEEQLKVEKVFSENIVLENVDQVFIRGSYDCVVLQQLIHRLKYSYWSAAQEVLPRVLAPCTPTFHSMPSNTVIVPVPLHSRRIRERGFNQASLIAYALRRMTDWKVEPILERHRYTKPQAQLSEKLRRTNVVDAFEVATGKMVAPHSVMLVDDVLTTGSTLTECARVLMEYGVQNISVFCLAKG